MEKRFTHMNGEPNALKGARSVRRGVHVASSNGRPELTLLIISTQRPDVKVIDGTIKTNLQGRLCFQMPDNASSMTILDSVRAADLPDIKGRAIWRDGTEMSEVQVPLLSDDKIGTLLEPMREKKEITLKVVPPLDSPNEDSKGVGV